MPPCPLLTPLVKGTTHLANSGCECFRVGGNREWQGSRTASWGSMLSRSLDAHRPQGVHVAAKLLDLVGEVVILQEYNNAHDKAIEVICVRCTVLTALAGQVR